MEDFDEEAEAAARPKEEEDDEDDEGLVGGELSLSLLHLCKKKTQLLGLDSMWRNHGSSNSYSYFSRSSFKVG